MNKLNCFRYLRQKSRKKFFKEVNIALAGQANVGKSVIFNHLTGLHQHIGNWPGKTIEKAEGRLFYKGHIINVVDLPGIYSLTTYSMEEIISREYIFTEKPDFIVNVVDATHLERNLIFTLQLLELERPTVMALNMVNLLKEKGIKIDYKKLEKILGIPVVPVAAIYRKGIARTLDEGLKLIKQKRKRKILRFGKEVEEAISKLISILKHEKSPYPKRWLAIKLLEKDRYVYELLKNKPKIIKKANKICLELEKIHGHDSSLVIADERCQLASRIAQEVQKIVEPEKITFTEKFDMLSLDKIFGYFIMGAIFASMFFLVFKFGGFMSNLLESLFSYFQQILKHTFGNSLPASFLYSIIGSVFALIEIALPYIFPFYLILYLLEDWGYIARVAFLMDNFMHKVGVHGKAAIPFLLGFGCNVPACLSCKIMETERERFITGFLTTLIPCSAVTVIILGLVGKYVGIMYAFGLYLLAILVLLVMGKLASKIVPGEPFELIMEMPDYKKPNLKTVLLQTWFRLKEFLTIASPLVIISGVIIDAIHTFGYTSYVVDFLSPITVNWLGLPKIAGVLLIFGILRKELILVMLATLTGTTNFSVIFSHVQMITLTVLSMFYIPCIATIAALWKEFGWKRTLIIVLFEILFAILLAGIISKILLPIAQKI